MEKPIPTPILEARQLNQWFPSGTGLFATEGVGERGGWVRAVDGVDLTVPRGHVIGVAGGSGSGKTTLAMTLLRLYTPTSGSVIFEGKDITRTSNNRLKDFRRQAQMIFQDPYGSLNPRFTTFRTVIEPLIVHSIGSKGERLHLVKRALELAELTPPEEFLDRYPHELSGGQRQRLCIARGLVVGAKLLVADEPVSMLDVSVRAGVLSLLMSLVHDLGLSILFISHDIACMRYICNAINIMYRGRIVESGSTEQIVQRPLHPYTQALIAAVPEMDVDVRRGRSRIKGEWLSATETSTGCRFRFQCPAVSPLCAEQDPELKAVDTMGHTVACFNHQTGNN